MLIEEVEGILPEILLSNKGPEIKQLTPELRT
jgi:hypothetical protein